ncbi:MAG: hypothetical protein AB1552_14355 [Nitrospirota bacterium]
MHEDGNYRKTPGSLGCPVVLPGTDLAYRVESAKKANGSGATILVVQYQDDKKVDVENEGRLF